MAGWRGLNARAKENSLQLVMLYQARHNSDAQHMTIDTNGQMVMKSKQQLKEDFGIAPTDCDAENALASGLMPGAGPEAGLRRPVKTPLRRA
jgi:hypothetical protein